MSVSSISKNNLFSDGKSASALGLEPYSGIWEERNRQHLLRRLLCGVTKQNLSDYQNLSLDAIVNQFLSPVAEPTPPINNYFSDTEDPDVPDGTTWIYAPKSANGTIESQRIISLKGWFIDQVLHENSSIIPKLTLFWHSFLVTETGGVFIAKASYEYFKLLRRNSLGNYRTMIKELTIDPAMLSYLNGRRNVKVAPDENYGRELQELFCIGKGADAGFTEQDVQSAAKVLTGWFFDWDAPEQVGTITSYFRENQHDYTDKQFSAFYNNKIISRPDGTGGDTELDEMLDMIFDTQEVAKYICRRIYTFFVYNIIDDATEQNIIEPLAQIFRSNNYDILPVLETLFKSAHFNDEANHGCLIKSPAEMVFGLWREVGFDYDDPNDITTRGKTNRILHWHCEGMNMSIGDPPNVAGWPSYYQLPQYDKSWITTDTITDRGEIVQTWLGWGVWVSSELYLPTVALAFTKILDDPFDPNSLILEATNLLLGIPINEDVRNDLKTILLSGQEQDYYWTDAWAIYIGDESNMEAKNIVEWRLKQLYIHLLQLGEYQLF